MRKRWEQLRAAIRSRIRYRITRVGALFTAATVAVGVASIVSGNNLLFLILSAMLATLLGVLHALAALASVVWRAAAFLPFVVSPVTVAFGLLLLYPSLTASLVLLVAAYAVFLWKGLLG